MRTITIDDADNQVQMDGSGRLYHYRKDYLYKGDMKEEYTLVLLWSNEGKKDVSGHSGETVCPGIESGVPIPEQPANP